MVMLGTVVAVTFLPGLALVFQLQHPWIVATTAILGGLTSTLIWWRIRRGDPYWPWALQLVDTPLNGLVPILVALWSAPIGAGIAVGVHALMALVWARYVGKSWISIATVMLPPLLLVPRFIEVPWLAVEGSVSLSVFMISTLIYQRQQQAEAKQRAMASKAIIADAIEGAYQSAYSEVRILEHQIKNCLFSPGMATSILLEGPPPSPEQLVFRLNAIQQGLTDAQKLLKDGMEQLARDNSESTTTIAKVIDAMRSRMISDSSRVTPEVVGDELRDLPIRGKTNVLADCLVNLVRNSIEAGAKHVFINVRFAKTALVLQITDDGGGIAPEVLPKLFTPGVSYGKVNGTGHALHIIKVILETLGGRISLVPTQPKHGAAFELRLAFQRTPEEMFPEPELSEEPEELPVAERQATLH